MFAASVRLRLGQALKRDRFRHSPEPHFSGRDYGGIKVLVLQSNDFSAFSHSPSSLNVIRSRGNHLKGVRKAVLLKTRHVTECGTNTSWGYWRCVAAGMMRVAADPPSQSTATEQ
jgi:hypothetical protein